MQSSPIEDHRQKRKRIPPNKIVIDDQQNKFDKIWKQIAAETKQLKK